MALLLDDALEKLRTPRRNRYFYGQLLRASHLEREQDYLNRMRWYCEWGKPRFFIRQTGSLILTRCSARHLTRRPSKRLPIRVLRRWSVIPPMPWFPVTVFRRASVLTAC